MKTMIDKITLDVTSDVQTPSGDTVADKFDKKINRVNFYWSQFNRIIDSISKIGNMDGKPSKFNARFDISLEKFKL